MGSSFLFPPFSPFSSSLPLSLLMFRAAASSAFAFKFTNWKVQLQQYDRSGIFLFQVDNDNNFAWKKRSLLSVPEDLECFFDRNLQHFALRLNTIIFLII